MALDPIRHKAVLTSTSTIVSFLVAEGMTKDDACERVRWAAHVIQHSNQPLPEFSTRDMQEMSRVEAELEDESDQYQRPSNAPHASHPTCPACLHAAPHGAYGCLAWSEYDGNCDCSVTDVATCIAEWRMPPNAAPTTRSSTPPISTPASRESAEFNLNYLEDGFGG